jgi:hypothetical protein
MKETAIDSTGSFSVHLPRACILPMWGDLNTPCWWQIEKRGDVVWCRAHGGVDRVDN